MFFAKLHPLLVHFPVGLLVSGALFELYGNFRGEKIVAKAGAFNLRFGFWCSLPVAVVGFLGLKSVELKDEFKSFVTSHMLFTLSTIVIFSVFFSLRTRATSNPIAPPPIIRILASLIFLKDTCSAILIA